MDTPKLDFGDGFYYQPGIGVWKKDEQSGAEKLIFDRDELIAIMRWCDFVKGAREGARKA